MQIKPIPSSESAERRRGAEKRLREQHPRAAPARSEPDTQRLIHQLQVHQIELDPDVKAVVMSDHTGDPVLLEPERYGFLGVLSKPFASDTLRSTLTSVVGSLPTAP
jgi:DNA-binding NarL/FixJ family response regulator